MEENSTMTLDHDMVQSASTNPEANLASSGKRLLNLIIDSILVNILIGIVTSVAGISSNITDMLGIYFLVLIGCWLLYFAGMEAWTGKTIGKMITKSRVVDTRGNDITTGQAFGRTLCRIIPFEAFSFLGSKGIGWHDSIPGTRVINDR